MNSRIQWNFFIPTCHMANCGCYENESYTYYVLLFCDYL